ncbi:MAG: M24 family metallopeptidase [Chloroflexota bacterium]
MSNVPFDETKLNHVLEEAGIDAVLATSRHNVRYLTGGYYDHFHALAPRGGAGQYQAIVGIPRGRLDSTFYVGGGSEKRQLTALPIWVPVVDVSGGPTAQSAKVAAGLLRSRVPEHATIGIEFPFTPTDSFQALQRELPHARFVDATSALHELRAVKTAEELAILRRVADAVSESIVAAFRAGHDGVTTHDLSAVVAHQMADRGLEFLWSFTCAGPSYLRAPSTMTWNRGQVLHLDCGGEIGDWLADICRMGSRGEPSQLAKELHAECLELQDEIRRSIRPGTSYGELASEGQAALRRLPHAEIGRFVAHGIGMVSHEQPMIAAESKRPLEAGMVLSVETEFLDPSVGHVKIEDVVAVTPDGYEGLGDLGRDWQISE